MSFPGPLGVVVVCALLGSREGSTLATPCQAAPKACLGSGLQASAGVCGWCGLHEAEGWGIRDNFLNSWACPGCKGPCSMPLFLLSVSALASTPLSLSSTCSLSTIQLASWALSLNPCSAWDMQGSAGTSERP